MDKEMTLDKVANDIWTALSRGSLDRKSSFRWFALATATLNGRPSVRTVVLRRVDRDARTLFAYTDLRSSKFEDLSVNPTAEALFFDQGKMVQIRLQTTVELYVDGLVWEQNWTELSDRAKQDYATITAPGLAGPQGVDLTLAEQNFAVIALKVECADWLSLSREGHRRAQFDWRNEVDQAKWVTP